jgi:hypothetical protein
MYEIKMVKAIEALGAEILDQENQKNQALHKAEMFQGNFRREERLRLELENRKDDLEKTVNILRNEIREKQKLVENGYFNQKIEVQGITFDPHDILIRHQEGSWTAFRADYWTNQTEGYMATATSPGKALELLLEEEEKNNSIHAGK